MTAPTGTTQGDDAPKRGPERTERVGAGLMIGGGTLMLVGAGVLVPISAVRAINAAPPDPAKYTAVEPFTRDLNQYQHEMYDALRLGIAGGVTGLIGAATFIVGTGVWATGRRRERRAKRISFSVSPRRDSFHASATLRF